MTVKQLIEALTLDCAPNATVYVAGGACIGEIEDREWDGGLLSITPDEGQVFIHFNETGMNNYITTEYLED